MYTRKQFVEAAKAFREGLALCETEAERTTMRKCIDGACRVFAGSNPRFDEARFRRACDPYDTGGV